MKETKTIVKEDCDFCGKNAFYDGKTIKGPWAFMCEEHFNLYGVGLGIGKGQILKIDKTIEEEEEICNE